LPCLFARSPACLIHSRPLSATLVCRRTRQLLCRVGSEWTHGDPRLFFGRCADRSSEIHARRGAANRDQPCEVARVIEGKKVMSNSIVPLADLIRQFANGWLFAVTILAIFYAWWVAFRRLRGMQMQIDELRRELRTLQAQYSRLLVRRLKSATPRSRKAPKWSDPSSNMPQGTSSLAPEQPDKKDSNESALHVIALPNKSKG